MKDMTLGTDPEFTWNIQDTRPGRYTGMLPASFVLSRLERQGNLAIYKKDGKKYMLGSTGIMFADGASWELNPDASNSPNILVENIKDLLQTTQIVQNSLTTMDKELTLLMQPSVPLDVTMLGIWGDPELAEFGCDPDKSIHPRIVNPAEINAAEHPWRYNGGHIHFGPSFITEHNVEEVFSDGGENIYKFILLCDATIGMLGVMFDDIVSNLAAQRRTVYGQPGVYRVQPHGIEYRSLSNSWLLTASRAYEMLYVARWMEDLFESELPKHLDTYVGDIRQTMISGNRVEAQAILDDVVKFYDVQEFGYDIAAATDEANKVPDYWTREWRV